MMDSRQPSLAVKQHRTEISFHATPPALLPPELCPINNWDASGEDQLKCKGPMSHPLCLNKLSVSNDYWGTQLVDLWLDNIRND